MDNVKNDSYYLGKILVDLRFMIDHTAGKTIEEMTRDELLMDSIMFRLIQIYENGAKLTTNFKNLHNEIPWHAIKGMRNRIVHDYGVMDTNIIYDTVTRSIPALYDALKILL